MRLGLTRLSSPAWENRSASSWESAAVSSKLQSFCFFTVFFLTVGDSSVLLFVSVPM